MSDLTTMLSSQQGAIFNIATELAQYAGQPVQKAVGASAKLSLTASASWKTKNTGITFSLQPTASCTIGISDTSSTFQVATQIDDPTSTSKVMSGPIASKVFINIELDFDIQGSVSGSGTLSGVGIAGKASGSETATVSFCQPVDATLETGQALKQAFSDLVLPLDPTSTTRMTDGSLGRVNFDGALDCEVDVTYGLGSYKLSAPDVGLVQQSLSKAWEKLTPPSLDINVGAKASVAYKHADHFGLLISKTDDKSATVYLVRSGSNETNESVGITVGVTATNVSLSLDPTQITKTAEQITGNSSIASAIGNAVAQPANKLQTSLTAKLNNWISDVNGDAGLTFALSQQSGRTALFTFAVNLTTANLAQQSWNALLGGSVAQALQIGGFTLLAGSGVSSQLKRSSAIQFHFFNLFKWDQTNDYFSNAYTELAADGSIRVFQDTGQEQNIDTKNTLQALRIHFVATATEDTEANVGNAEVDLNLELSETDDLDAANVLKNVIAMIPAGKLLESAEDAIGDFLKTNPRGTLNIINVLKPSAYEKISCSPYAGKTPPPLPQTRDGSNWTGFQSATEALMPSLSFVAALTFKDWMDFNSIANTNSTGAVPNRRHPGNPQAVPPSFFSDRNLQNVQGQAIYFFLVSAGFLNLCEDLKILRSTTAQASVPGEWNEALQIITSAVKNDLHIDYGKPTIGALLYLCATGGAQVTAADTAIAKDSSSLTCTLTLA
ncbi:MAG TPA: hypothetical protein VMH05_04510 [Bryobacteraceae bacterium]|nr:hypothetical protein [Bryobacteraceae bacterium]